MQFERKRIILVVLLVVVTIGLAILVYNIFFKSDQDQYVIIDGQRVPIGQLPVIGPGGQLYDPLTGLPIEIDFRLPTTTAPSRPVAPEPDAVAQGGLTQVDRLARGDIKGVFPSTDGQLKFYDQETGRFFRLNDRGEFELLTDKVFHNVDQITWDTRGNQAILEYPDGSNIYYNFSTGQQVTLPRQMTDFAFSYTDQAIAFEWYNEYNPDDNWLGVARPDGNEIRFVEPIGDKGDKVFPQWSPDNRYVAFYTKSEGLDLISVIPLGANNENFQSFDVYGRGFESQWSTDKQNLLYSVHTADSGRRPELWVTTISGNQVGANNRPLDLQTWSSKCTFGSTGADLYCAVPQNLPPGIGWYPEQAVDYPDSFYRIDLQTGTQTLLALPAGTRDNYSAQQLVLSADGSRLYFLDALDSDIYSIQLK